MFVATFCACSGEMVALHALMKARKPAVTPTRPAKLLVISITFFHDHEELFIIPLYGRKSSKKIEMYLQYSETMPYSRNGILSLFCDSWGNPLCLGG